MSTLKATTIEPATGTTLTLGAAGDAVTLSSDSLQTNLYKDSGGNTLFQSDGAGTLSNVNAAIAGYGPKLIQTQEVFIDEVLPLTTSVDFITGIDSTYDKYWFVVEGFIPSGNSGSLYVHASVNAGSTWTVNMYTTYGRVYQYESNSSDGMSYMTGADNANGYPQPLLWEISNATDACCSGIFELYNPASTSFTKQFISRMVGMEYFPGMGEGIVGGYMNDTSAITGIRFASNSGMTIKAGKFSMYGIA